MIPMKKAKKQKTSTNKAMKTVIVSTVKCSENTVVHTTADGRTWSESTAMSTKGKGGMIFTTGDVKDVKPRKGFKVMGLDEIEKTVDVGAVMKEMRRIVEMYHVMAR